MCAAGLRLCVCWFCVRRRRLCAAAAAAVFLPPPRRARSCVVGRRSGPSRRRHTPFARAADLTLHARAHAGPALLLVGCGVVATSAARPASAKVAVSLYKKPAQHARARAYTHTAAARHRGGVGCCERKPVRRARAKKTPNHHQQHTPQPPAFSRSSFSLSVGAAAGNGVLPDRVDPPQVAL